MKSHPVAVPSYEVPDGRVKVAGTPSTGFDPIRHPYQQKHAALYSNLPPFHTSRRSHVPCQTF